MVSVVWRLERSICDAASPIRTSTIASSGTIRPSGARTVNAEMSLIP